ncbi:MAG: YraN family protein [Luteolibacter sp.]
MARRNTLKIFGFTALVATIVRRFSRSLNSPCHLATPDGKPQTRRWLGNYGEKVAEMYLRGQGLRILAKNFRGPHQGEVDLIAQDGKLLLFIEVKTRTEGAKIRGYDAVNRSKQALIERGANAWLKRLRTREIPWRFDIIEITVSDGEKPRLNHIRDAF